MAERWQTKRGEAGRWHQPWQNEPGRDASSPLLPAAAGPNGIVPLYLSLILLVLAFFIVMVSYSSLDAERSARVMSSIAGTFAAETARPTDPATDGAQRGDVLDGEDLEQSLKRLFATELAVAEFRQVMPGRVLEIEMAAGELFHPERARLRSTRLRLLDRLIATVTMRPHGERVEVQGLIGTGTASGPLPTAPSALAIGRAAALGETLTSRGLPRSHLAMGVWPGETDRILLVFTIRAGEGDGGGDAAGSGFEDGGQ